jgi:hypothetical protein
VSTIRHDHRRPRGPRPAQAVPGEPPSRRALRAGVIAILAFPAAPTVAFAVSPLLTVPGGPSPASSIVLLVLIAGFCAALVYGVRAMRAGVACLRVAGIASSDRGGALLGMLLGAGALAIEVVLVIALFTGNFNP